jgi:hypothetical protein
VIAVFTKYDQFKRDVGMKLDDQGHDWDPALLNAEMERIFNEEFLANLKGSPPTVCLGSEDFYHLAFITLIAVPQECTGMANGVLILFKRLPLRSPSASLLSCC